MEWEVELMGSNMKSLGESFSGDEGAVKKYKASALFVSMAWFLGILGVHYALLFHVLWRDEIRAVVGQLWKRWCGQ